MLFSNNDYYSAEISALSMIADISFSPETAQVQTEHSSESPVQPETDAKLIEKVLSKFYACIQLGPTSACTCCRRFMYASSLRNISDVIRESFLEVLGNFTSNPSLGKQICTTCYGALKQNRLPAQSTMNQLEPEPIPDVLKNLCPLERQLVSKIIPFMQIYALPKGNQKGLKGQIVLVPVNVIDTICKLPRNAPRSNLIALNLKRRLADLHSVTSQFIRPDFIEEALSYLCKNNKYYSDIQYDVTWKDDMQLLNDIDGHCNDHSPVELAVQEELDSEAEVENQNSADIIEKLNLARSLNTHTSLYPEEGPNQISNEIVNIAPGEGCVPTSFFYRKSWESESNPVLFPTGNFSFNQDRQVKISVKKYINRRLLAEDHRFAESPEYIFQCLHWMESVSVQEKINITMRKKKTAIFQLAHF